MLDLAMLVLFFGFCFIVFMILFLAKNSQCPHCKSYVDKEATVCPKCGKDVNND